MELVHESSKSGMRVFLIRGLGDERDHAERELLEAGVPLALPHRAIWSVHLSRWESWFLLVRDSSGHACGGFAIENVQTRALPGHKILRVGRFGGSRPIEVCEVAVEALASLARSTPRVLRLQVNVFSRDGRQQIGKALENLGFREIRPPGSYQHTLGIDLKPTEDKIHASFTRDARKRIRETVEMSLRSQVITDPAFVDRIDELQQGAMQRTGGYKPHQDWRGVLTMSQKYPDLSRVVGLFQGEATTPENMGAFGWSLNHGDHVEHRAAGSTRQSDARIPYGYLLVWDMVQWAKSVGAQWFDMGGVTVAEGDENHLEGISRFKKYFSREVLEVGAEWVLEPAPLQAKIASAISNSTERVRAWRAKKI
jgi:hypothetical protein